MASRAEMLEQVIRREGPFNHLAADRGGPTNWGITQTTLAAWRGRPVSREEVQALSPEEAKTIYEALYYHRPHFDRLPEPLDDLMFDWGVNSGPFIPVQELQQLIGVEADGVVGPRTLLAVGLYPPTRLVNKLVARRIKMYGRICKKDPSQVVFLQGWLSRALEFLIP